MTLFTPIPNYTDDVKTGSPHWYISYNSTSGDYGCDTTALVLGQMEYFLVLDGDHRGQLNEIVQTSCLEENRLKRCLNYVRSNKEKLNEKSDPIL